MTERDFDEYEFGNVILSEEELSDYDDSDGDFDDSSDDEAEDYDEFNKEFRFFIKKDMPVDRPQKLLRMINQRVYQVYNAAPEEEGTNIFVSNRMRFKFDNPTKDQLKRVRCEDLSDHLKGPDELKVRLISFE